jgi:hypothetical protein
MSLFATAEGSFGMVAPEDGDLAMSYSAGGGGGFTTAGKHTSAHLTGSIAFRSGGVDLTGWTLQQRLEVGADARLGRALLRASAALSSARREDELLGASASRAATLTLTGAWAYSTAQLTAGIAENAADLVGTTATDYVIFVPEEYNARTTFATLNATRIFANGRLAISAVGRTLRVVATDRPAQWEHGAGLTASYVIGLLTFALDERLSYGGNDTAARTANVLYLRVTRSFGGKLW